MSEYILALDVGFAKTGWCVFRSGYPVEFGLVETKKSEKKHVRIADDRAYRATVLASGIAEIIENYNVKGCVAELPSGGGKSANAVAFMSSAIAVAASVMSLLKIPVEWTTPSEGKISLCGKASASKDEIMSAVRKLYPDVDWPKAKNKFEDIADAVGAYVASKNGNIIRFYE